MYKIEEMYDLSHTIAKDYFKKYNFAWEILPNIKDIVLELIKTLDKSEYNEVKENVFIHKSCKVYESSYIEGPCIVGPNTEIRHGAFIRGNVIVGSDCVVGNSCEIKNSILFDNAQAPHFNYVGDSILGYKSHLGAGAKTSNLKSDKSLIVIKDGENSIETGLKKIGALVGDLVEVGCNTILNPGTVIGKNTMIYPVCSVRGVVKENSIYKSNKEIVEKK